MAFRIVFANSKRDKVHINRYQRGGNPIVSTTSTPAVSIHVYKELEEEENQEEFEQVKIKYLDVEINGERLNYIRENLNREEIKRNLTTEKIDSDYQFLMGVFPKKPCNIRIIVIDNFNQETFSDYFEVT